MIITSRLSKLQSLPERDLAHVVAHVSAWDELRGKRTFLTGASGFVGRWLSESFAWANAELGLGAELVRLPRDGFLQGPFDLGIHAAKAESLSADTELTRHVLQFAGERGVARFLFMSSGAVYGTAPLGVTEEFPCNPETDYARAKVVGEQLCQEQKFSSVIARMFTFLGPGLPLDANFAVGNFVNDVLGGGPVRVLGDGTARRSYLYAADLAVWLWTLLLRGEAGWPYNVGSPEAVSIGDLAQMVVAQTRSEIAIEVMGGGRSSDYVPSVERAWTDLGLRPLIGLEEGIRRMYRWHKEREMSQVPATTP